MKVDSVHEDVRPSYNHSDDAKAGYIEQITQTTQSMTAAFTIGILIVVLRVVNNESC